MKPLANKYLNFCLNVEKSIPLISVETGQAGLTVYWSKKLCPVSVASSSGKMFAATLQISAQMEK
jgi:hypothetical protein